MNYSFDESETMGGDFNPIFKFKEKGDKLTGVLVNNKHQVGPHKQEIWTIKTDKDGEVDIWGSTVLDGQLGLLELRHNAVEITYDGDGERKGGNNPPHLFTVRAVPVGADGKQAGDDPVLKQLAQPKENTISPEEQTDRDKIMEEMEIDEDSIEQE